MLQVTIFIVNRKMSDQSFIGFWCGKHGVLPRERFVILWHFLVTAKVLQIKQEKQRIYGLRALR